MGLGEMGFIFELWEVKEMNDSEPDYMSSMKVGFKWGLRVLKEEVGVRS